MGPNFNPTNTLVNISGITCSLLNTITSTSIVCALYAGSQVSIPIPIDAPVGVNVVDTSTLLSSPTVYLVTFAACPPVSLTSVSGCVDVGLTTTKCNTSTAILTLRGSGFTPLPSRQAGRSC